MTPLNLPFSQTIYWILQSIPASGYSNIQQDPNNPINLPCSDTFHIIQGELFGLIQWIHWILLDTAAAFRCPGWLYGSFSGSSKIQQDRISYGSIEFISFLKLHWILQSPTHLDPVKSSRIQWIHWTYHLLRGFMESIHSTHAYPMLPLNLLCPGNNCHWIYTIYTASISFWNNGPQWHHVTKGVVHCYNGITTIGDYWNNQ